MEGIGSMSQKEVRDIRQRAYRYALRAIKLYQYLQEQRDGAGWILGKQYLRAATSIGANIEEAQASESRADFVHKLGIAQKEARETLYWLRLIADSRIVSASRLRALTKETEELVAVITAIVVNAKRRTGSE
jgi:four helix bundle protein